MNENVYKVLMGFIKLSDTKKSLFITEINRYQQSSYTEKLSLNESIRLKSSVGPKNSICGCCGR